MPELLSDVKLPGETMVTAVAESADPGLGFEEMRSFWLELESANPTMLPGWSVLENKSVEPRYIT